MADGAPAGKIEYTAFHRVLNIGIDIYKLRQDGIAAQIHTTEPAGGDRISILSDASDRYYGTFRP